METQEYIGTYLSLEEANEAAEDATRRLSEEGIEVKEVLMQELEGGEYWVELVWKSGEKELVIPETGEPLEDYKRRRNILIVVVGITTTLAIGGILTAIRGK